MKTSYIAILLVSAAALPIGAQAGLTNGGFEQPPHTPGVPDFDLPLDSTVPGWDTTATDHTMEIWSDNFQGVPAYEGTQFAELNANEVATLYQDSTGIAAGSLLGFQFAHRGRLGIDTLALRIIDLGLDNAIGGGDDTTLFTQQYSDNNTAWGFHTNSAPIAALGNTIRFAYDSVSAAGGNPTFGNFLDAVDFGIGVGTGAAVPEPASLSMFVGGLMPLYWASRRRKTARPV